MALNFGADDIPETLDKQDFDRAGPGSFHFNVTAMDEGEDENPMVVDTTLLAGDPISEVGKTHREYFNKPTASQTPEARQATSGRFLLFAVAVGLATEEEVEAGRAAGKGVTVDYNLALGRQFCGELRSKPYKNTAGEMVDGKPKLDYRIYHPASEKAKGIPLNEAKLGDQGTGKAAADPFGNF